MVTLADSLVSASSRPLNIRCRPDLTSRKQRYHGSPYWIVKEPVGLNYFRFQEEEFSILQMLDGKTSLDDIKHRYESLFPPGKITVEEIARFIGNLFQSGLLMADVTGQGIQLIQRKEERHRKQLLATLSNVLAIRFKGIDPERILNWLYPKTRWFFSQTTVLLCLSLALCAFLLVTVQWETFQAKLPSFHTFFAGKNWLWLGLTLAVTKVLHEFGHGLSCKHFGGECHEMGIMILVLTPCLYCNVSDSWMLPNKWHRAAIGAAGMYVELVIASIATFIWWFTESGTIIHQLSLSIMFVCSVSTLLFNGNPLLRYDGYYILSDILEIPNLRQKSSAILGRKLGALCLGLEEPEDPFLPQRNQALFALYSVAAVIYRWLIVFGILYFLYKVFENTGFQIIGQLIATFALYGLLVQPLWKLGKYLSVPGRLQSVKTPNFVTTLVVVLLVLAGILFVPLPYHVICTLEIQPHDAARVYVEVPGILVKSYVEPGNRVQKGDRLAELNNLDLQLESIRLQGELSTLEEEIKNLHFERNQSRGDSARRAGNELLAAKERKQSASTRLEQQQEDLDRLTLTAPRDGYIFPPPFKSGRPAAEGMLPTWSGTPIEPKNHGARLQTSELFCQIGDQGHMEAVLAIDQSDRNFVAEDQHVEIILNHLPNLTFESKIERIATTEMTEPPRRLTERAGGELMTETDATGREQLMSTTYQARVLLADPQHLLRIGLRGQAKIETAPRTLGNRIWRLLSETFNFKL
jgi:putative peptide zinc metalloprotease protein